MLSRALKLHKKQITLLYGKVNPSALNGCLGQDFAIRTASIVSMETVISCVFFVFESWQIQSKHGLSAT